MASQKCNKCKTIKPIGEFVGINEKIRKSCDVCAMRSKLKERERRKTIKALLNEDKQHCTKCNQWRLPEFFKTKVCSLCLERSKKTYTISKFIHEKHCKFILKSYRCNDKRDGRENNMTLEMVMNLLDNAECHYCKNKKDPLGLDRVDNTKGHIEGNIVPCCPSCNCRKRTKAYEDFIELIKCKV